MGLLDSILGGIAGSALGRGRGRSNILIALLPVVLSMLANSRGGAASARRAMPASDLGSGGGNLGGRNGSGALAGIGGLGALLQRFQQKGYGDHVQSWVGTGENQPIPPEALSDVFDGDQLSEIASQAGVSEDEARTGLSELLPQVVDRLTPEGQLPESEQLLSSIDDFDRELQQQRH